MTCAGCGRVNRAESRFCVGCGKPLVPRCPTCGVESEAGAQFCGACGAPFGPPPTQAGRAEARKVVTIVFADLVGSTALHERLDPESVTRFMDDYYRAMRAPIEAHGGSVIQLLGDGVLCAFGVPRVAEDDAIRGVRAAVGMQRAFGEFAGAHRALAGAIGLRVAVNTGEVVVSDEHPAGIGDPLNVAARLQQEAHDGDVLIGEATASLVRDRVTLERVGTFALKGRTETVTASRVVSLERPTGMPASAFVGLPSSGPSSCSSASAPTDS
jgi:class 3 adenylate cyclase